MTTAHALDVRRVDVDTLHPHPRNARRGDVHGIAESLQRHGQYRPIVVRAATSEIIAGNHTWRATKSLGWSEIDAVFLDVSEDEALRILLIDNRLNDVASYDDGALVEVLNALADTDDGLTGTGFVEADLAKLLAKLTGEAADDDVSEQMGSLEYRVLIDCADEREQALLIERFESEGLAARALIS